MDKVKESDIIEEMFAWLQERKAEMEREKEKCVSVQAYATAQHYQSCYGVFRAVEKYLQYQIDAEIKEYLRQISAEKNGKEESFKHEYEAVWETDENDKIQAEAGGDAEMMGAEMMGGE